MVTRQDSAHHLMLSEKSEPQNFSLQYSITRIYAARPDGNQPRSTEARAPGERERETEDTARYRASVIGAATCQASLVPRRHWITCKKMTSG